MKTRIRLSKILVIMLMPFFWINASGVMKIEVGGPGRISGCIRNATSNQPLECVSVTLFSATDSSMIVGTLSNSDGRFVISMLTPDNYFLEISEPGFESKHIGTLSIQPVSNRFDIGEVHLNPVAERRKRKL